MRDDLRALLAILDALEIDLKALPVNTMSSGNGYVEHFVLQADVWRLADRLAAEVSRLK